MGLKKKTINMVKKVLTNENKRKLYSEEELTYMEMALLRLQVERKRRKAERQSKKGFGYQSEETND